MKAKRNSRVRIVAASGFGDHVVEAATWPPSQTGSRHLPNAAVITNLITGVAQVVRNDFFTFIMQPYCIQNFNMAWH
jgi:hypothetical protein